jgi:hypothetical protein
MNEDTKPRDLQTQPSEPLMIVDMGQATKLTLGSAYITPYYEMGVPPYNHWIPV